MTAPTAPEPLPKSAALMADAGAAYDREDRAWFYALPTDRLAFLWGVACANPTGTAWDDEVYDALAERGWFEGDVDS